ncbi:MAG: DUF692 domain-containing protein [Candidatus Melainabacteria bacterium]
MRDNFADTPQESGFQGCPVLGVGLGLRKRLLEDTLAAMDVIDWVECTPENHMGLGGKSLQNLQRAAQIYPVVSHGVSLSLGSISPLNANYLAELEALFDWLDPPWFSDHLCFSEVDGEYFNDLIPLPRTPETVQHVAGRIKQLQDRFQRPFLIENISQYLEFEEDSLRESDFLAAILETADCGLLLDVNNAYVNHRNHGSDPKALIAALPLNRVVQIHVAGHTPQEDMVIDTHGETVCTDVWDLLRWTLAQQDCRPCGVMIERDSHFPPFEDLRSELMQLRAIWDESRQPVKELSHGYA